MRYAVFEQRLFYYKFNLQSISQQYWYGSRICVKKFLKSPQWIRNLKFGKRPWWRLDKLRLNHILKDGGWHFCNLKDSEKLLYKYKNMCETNDPYIFKEQIDPKYLNVDEIKKSIDLGIDLIGRGHQFKKVNIDEQYPKYILENSNKFKDWII
jgi:beta-1,4-mannosyl-glycoprotein beta-1,4-N-acetylglucosaminyltransferase